MHKFCLFPLTVILLTSSSSGLNPKRIDIGASIGYFSNFTIVPFVYRETYSIQISYTMVTNGSHKITCGWDSETSTYERDGTYYSFVPISNKVISGYAGDVFTFDYYIPYKYVCHENEMYLFDYDYLSNKTNTFYLSLSEKKKMENRNLGSEGILYGDTYYDVDSIGSFIKREAAVEIINYNDAIETDARKILPLDRIKLDFFNTNGHKSLIEEDNDLTLSISGEDYMDFEPLLGHGGILNESSKSIEVPLRFKYDDDGFASLILDETVFGYDMGDGAEAYKEALALPKSKNPYPTYHLKVSNVSEALGSYFYEFDVGKGDDFFGSCRNSTWCVEVS